MLLREILMVVRRKAWLLVFGVVVGAIVGVWLNTGGTPQYQTSAGVAVIRRTTQVKLEPRFQTSAIDDLNINDRTDAGLLTLASMVTNAAVARNAYDKLKDQLPPAIKTPQDLLSHVTGEVRDGVIRVKVTANEPEFAAQLADVWAESYAQYVNRLYAGQNVAVDLTSQVSDAKKRYEDAQAALVTFLGTNRQSAVATQIQEKQAVLDRLVQVRVDEVAGPLQQLHQRRQRTEAVLGDAEALKALLANSGSEATNAANTLGLLVLQYNAIQSNVDETLSLPSDKAVAVKPASSQPSFSFVPQRLEDVAISSANMEKDLDNLISTLKARLADYDAQIAAQSGQATNANAAAQDPDMQKLFAEIASLQAEAEALKAQQQELQSNRDRLWDSFTLLSNAAQQVLLTASADDGTVLRFAIPATVSKNSTQTPPRQSAIVGAFLGLLLALALAFLLELVDDKVRSRMDVEEVLNLPVMSLVPKGATTVEGRPVSLAQPEAPVAEGVRFMRTALEQVKEPVRSLLITSMTPGEGKTTVATNLAVVSARAGMPVILIDANLRTPQVHRAFGLSNKDGLSDLLMANDSSLESHLQTTAVPGLRVLTAGSGTGVAPDLLGRPILRTLIAEATSLADLVLVDAAAAKPFTDSAIISGLVQGVVLVLRPGSASVTDIQHFQQDVQAVSGQMLGVVLNKVSRGILRPWGGRSGNRQSEPKVALTGEKPSPGTA